LPQEEKLMREELLHFIWRFRYFNHHELFTEAGETVWIQAPGEQNVHQGPDFLHARISIGGILREGPVELHIRTSDWHRHAHDGDIHYREVVLHVVWENDLEDSPGGLPVLVLGHRVPKLLLGRYRQWMDSRSFIPCERRLPAVDASTRAGWLQQLLWHRLQQRALFIRSCLEDNRQHWEETTWWLMARSMGQPVNAKAFEVIGRSLPVSLLARHRGEPVRLEALLLGQAGLLEGEFAGEYPRALQKEYSFCRVKYGLSVSPVPLSFLRMRPGHFPTVRLAQLAGLLGRPGGWFGRIRDADSPRDLAALLDVTVTGYWDDHYVLARSPGHESRLSSASKPILSSAHRPRRMGEAMKKSLVINAFVPLLFAYGWLRGLPAYQEKAVRWLEETGPEDNTIITGWRRLGVPVTNAATSQALLELKKSYCNDKKCLDCAIGQRLLGQGPDA
jgi:hypothetical protein